MRHINNWYNLIMGLLQVPQGSVTLIQDTSSFKSEDNFTFAEILSQYSKEDYSKNSQISIESPKISEWKNMHFLEKLSDKITDELTCATNFTEMSSCKSTKGSLLDEQYKKLDIKEEVELVKDKARSLKNKITIANNEISRLNSQEKALKNSVYNASLELQHLEMIETSSGITDKVQNMQKLYLNKTQMCKKHKFYLEKLKGQVADKDKELNDKETELKNLQAKAKTLRLGFSKIKSCKSFDMSAMKTNLDIVQWQLEDKSPPVIRKNIRPLTCKNLLSTQVLDLTLGNVKDYITDRFDLYNENGKLDLEKKINDCQDKSIEFEQMITEEIISFEDNKNDIQQRYMKNKEELIKAGGKFKEDWVKVRLQEQSQKKKDLLVLITQAKQVESPYRVTGSLLCEHREILRAVREELMKCYRNVKALKKERFRLRETIDINDMELDDKKLEIGKLKQFQGSFCKL
ncbi:hypothetical protein SteCoe_22116 [Stentor coeruleus]|uniref:Uncharacterized protein n=1 Tax=Stentor coeruleus TaxID=5963 RepID=A0A1R2BMZ7_9CILI|nr:hypothetical protein SteCoe_22116 [Stentor coeruleus]